MSNPTFKLRLDDGTAILFTLEVIHVDGKPDPAHIAEIIKSAEASLIQWSLRVHTARRSDRLFLIGEIADTLGARFTNPAERWKTTVSATIC